MNIVKEWTKLDQLIYEMEKKIRDIQNLSNEPDVETMILAETQHLQQENEQLKKKQFPCMLRNENGRYLCPDCGEAVSSDFVEQKKKFCPECGKRIMLPTVFEEI